MNQTSRPVRRFALALGMATLLCVGACQIALPGSGGGLRAGTMPPDLRYVPQQKIRSAMWILAEEIQALEAVLQQDPERDPVAKRSEVQARLARMRAAAAQLDTPGRTTQHPVLNQYLERFIARIRHAEGALGQDPPNYFPASTLSGSCFLCHGLSSAAVENQDLRRSTSG